MEESNSSSTKMSIFVGSRKRVKEKSKKVYEGRGNMGGGKETLWGVENPIESRESLVVVALVSRSKEHVVVWSTNLWGGREVFRRLVV